MVNWESLKNNIGKKVIILLLSIAFAYYIAFFHVSKPNITEIKVNDQVVFVQVADSDAERALGLSFTQELKNDAGMLFVFDVIGVKNFWMRDMNYDLDIIWIDENKKVVGFFEDVKKESYNKLHPEYSRIYKSPETTKYVLELNAGSIKNLKIKVGDSIDFHY
jgi:uncharacterized membrane protein (UPF0127 family)